MSLLGKKWVFQGRDLASVLDHDLDDDSVTFHDPFLMKDMKKGVERLKTAIESQERIIIFGDYDVDGISGTALLVQTLRELGANVSYRLPTRQDGYGINPKWIDTFIDLEIGVLITVDCGISNFDEIQTATNNGIDVIITDHHTVPEKIPNAYAILHPNLPDDTYPFHVLAGSAVAYKLAVALMHDIRGVDAARDWALKCADLASLGTVADCVALKGENRWIVKRGLEQMRETNWEGLKILLKNAGVEKITGHDSDVIGFRIGPRINAAGRLETPVYSLQLLLNENGAGQGLAQKLEDLNQIRRQMVEDAMVEAEAQIEANSLLEKNILIAWSADWPAGIIGLIAARLSEKYNRPAIILEDRGPELVASCRSPESFNVVNALKAAKDHLERYGGHAGAAGFTVLKDKLDPFVEAVQAYADKTLEGVDLTPILPIDFEISLTDITLGLARQLATLEPFGMGNPRPLFIMKGVNPKQLQTVGQEHRHLRFQVQNGPQRVSAIAFRFGEHYATLQTAIFENKRSVDVVFEIERNVWNGRERVQIKVVDMGLGE
jgi:single-stranded-DNA-specific exonuclease